MCASPAVYHDERARAGAQRPFAAFSMGGAWRFALLLALITVSGSYVLRPPPCRAARRACAIRAQLVPVEKPDDDDGAGDNNGGDDSKILSVSQVEDAAGQAIEAVGGRSVASVQFMITNAMRAQLGALGYSAEEVDRMDPPRAAAILAQGVPSSKQAQSRPKRKTDRFELQFTCNVCDAPNSHSISRHAYAKGTVLVTCPNCNSAHLIADNLNWIEDDFKNLEQAMAKRGTPVRRIVNDGVAASAASAAMSALQNEEGDDATDGDAAEKEELAAPTGGDPRKAATVVGRIEGIDEDQALRIREAVRAAKRNKRAAPDESE